MESISDKFFRLGNRSKINEQVAPNSYYVSLLESLLTENLGRYLRRYHSAVKRDQGTPATSQFDPRAKPAMSAEVPIPDSLKTRPLYPAATREKFYTGAEGAASKLSKVLRKRSARMDARRIRGTAPDASPAETAAYQRMMSGMERASSPRAVSQRSQQAPAPNERGGLRNLFRKGVEKVRGMLGGSRKPAPVMFDPNIKRGQFEKGLQGDTLTSRDKLGPTHAKVALTTGNLAQQQDLSKSFQGHVDDRRRDFYRNAYQAKLDNPESPEARTQRRIYGR